MATRTLLDALQPELFLRRVTRGDEVDDLMLLLIEHAAPALAGSAWLAEVCEAVAVACLGDNHLWQDLALPSRGELSALMLQCFPTLAARNERDMKWKKFLYKQLCEREQLFICRAPSCAMCSDYGLCFGAEDDPVLHQAAEAACAHADGQIQSK